MKRTKYPELCYARSGDDWRFVDTATGQYVGPAHPTEASLLADLDREAGLYGHESSPPPPIDMVLPCPRCGLLHIDRPDPPPGEWTNPPHKSHLCRVEDGGCGHVWRPADVATNGVAAVKTRGEKDGPADDGELVDPDWLLSVGATGGNDEPDTDVYDIKAGGGLVVRIVIRFRRGEIAGSSIGLGWSSTFGTHTVSLAYTIDDDPTRGHVRRLCRDLGVPLAEARPCTA